MVLRLGLTLPASLVTEVALLVSLHRGSSIYLQAVDCGIVEVYLPRDVKMDDERDVEITGKILGQNAMEMWWFIGYNYTLDNRALDAAINMIHDSLFVGPLWGIQFDPPQHSQPLRVPARDDDIEVVPHPEPQVLSSMVPLPLRIQALRREEIL
ncbi:hypothetical protein PUNSTDRAFT_43426 [Punctularia strigosozonata HHB-11173 SS5]|uniref:uncharacterized protein n=1 Tax=Punctularia strigosozonata (strain HHB-11173) TaxID=741275 RepID=UPI000441668E|nr:uncharacterized protein PUNSTDRAFT_43426 [Punctularia strigosozonata HHB-11173 SS5]EIN10553.1 hypothetical protein PUNSTDRAFT_43426 [Punctularia strigosozonata HHB-11173 SS5]